MLFAALPLLPSIAFRETEPEIRRSVEVIELTPEEQSRLPELSTAQIDLPPLFNDDPLLLPDANLVPLPAPNQADPPPLPGGFFSEPLFPSFPSASLPSFSLPVSPVPYPPPPAQTPAPRTSPSPQGPLPDLEPADPSPSANVEPNRPDANAEPSNESQIAANGETASPEQTTPTEVPPETTEQWEEQIVQARLAEIQQRREQLALLAPDATATGEGEPLELYTSWFEQAVTWLGNDYQGNNAEAIDIEVAYPEAACLRGLSGAAIVGVLVDEEGKVVEEPAPQLLQGSGYRVFNEKALEAAQAHPFEATGNKQAYQVRMKFEYSPDNCQSEENPEQVSSLWR
ncbi:MAG: hypothetical protein Kow00121_15720 [Elainellaceae cyanobacterium]